MPFLKEYPQVKIIQDIARKKKVAIYLVGGFLRDYLLKRPTLDLDFAVERDALKVSRDFAKRIKGAYVLLDKKQGSARAVKKIQGTIHIFDFTDFRAETFRQDLLHRDFTINTMHIDLNTVNVKTEISDVLKISKTGLKDFKEKRIRMASVNAFREDPLRMMRAFSLRASLGFKIETKTLAQLKKDKDLIKNVSYERIRQELFRILETDKAALNLKAMDRAKLLEKIIPQIRVMFNCHQGGYHHLNVWPHSLEVVAQLEKIKLSAEALAYVKKSLGGGRSRWALMKLAALFHDIGKPETRKKKDSGYSFHGHEHVGKNIVRCIAKMLKLSVRERHAVEAMVQWHLRPGYLSNFKKPSERAIYRYFRDTKEEAVSTLLVSLADQRSTRGPLTTENDQKHHEKICLSLVQRYFDQNREKPHIPFINGHDIIKKFKLKPSPLIGKILSELHEKQSLGKITNKPEALALAGKIVRM